MKWRKHASELSLHALWLEVSLFQFYYQHWEQQQPWNPPFSHICYSTLHTPAENQEFFIFLPRSLRNVLEPASTCLSMQATQVAHTSIHTQMHTHNHMHWIIQGKGELRTSLVLLKVWLTLNSDYIALGVILLNIENVYRRRFHNFFCFICICPSWISWCFFSLPRSSWRAALTLSMSSALSQFALITDEYLRAQDRHLRDATSFWVLWNINKFSALFPLLSNYHL